MEVQVQTPAAAGLFLRPWLLHSFPHALPGVLGTGTQQLSGLPKCWRSNTTLSPDFLEFIYFFLVLEFELWDLDILDKCSTTELYMPSPFLI